MLQRQDLGEFLCVPLKMAALIYRLILIIAITRWWGIELDMLDDKLSDCVYSVWGGCRNCVLVCSCLT